MNIGHYAVNYDFAIIGSGIAGLIVARKLSRSFPNHSIGIFEKEKTVGGRLKSKKLSNNAGIVELGAGRFHLKKHSRLHALMNDFSMSLKPFCYHLSSLHSSLYETTRTLISKICCELEKAYITSSLNQREEWSFSEASEYFIGKNKTDLLFFCIGYDSLENPMISFKNGFDIIRNHPETECFWERSSKSWVSPSEGFQELAFRIKSSLKNNCSFYTDHLLQ